MGLAEAKGLEVRVEVEDFQVVVAHSKREDEAYAIECAEFVSRFLSQAIEGASAESLRQHFLGLNLFLALAFDGGARSGVPNFALERLFTRGIIETSETFAMGKTRHKIADYLRPAQRIFDEAKFEPSGELRVFLELEERVIARQTPEFRISAAGELSSSGAETHELGICFTSDRSLENLRTSRPILLSELGPRRWSLTGRPPVGRILAYEYSHQPRCFRLR